ncbi:hypothetical protein CHLRE_31g758497v5 [Chlamydomonas reinhardtii]|uniref:Uncharacterized protein n=1 Tax=Chlamydomonas reinhardtii TaxID=3055 RepID=A0A2K3CMY0_CHLRE|nr:uncharacterized protein CHLRE_31g758497v5 [Chlamydomonas reinhardtii]PNW69639.1 hypothetical protein CHLRE_31g758497v5 [Chlamydomonas reinhardtii]
MRGAMNIIMAEFLRDPPPQDATPSNIKAGAEGPRPAPGAPNRAAGSGSAQRVSQRGRRWSQQKAIRRGDWA